MGVLQKIRDAGDIVWNISGEDCFFFFLWISDARGCLDFSEERLVSVHRFHGRRVRRIFFFFLLGTLSLILFPIVCDELTAKYIFTYYFKNKKIKLLSVMIISLILLRFIDIM